ncbi:hypothetical protein B0A81_20290 [Flavobacterium plurextorum]|uniref:Lipoprotein n=1 Tax=Flavobacterium plurextorum TaxID=1114867 RepID=A0ABX4CNZ4_9FLAO|nr:hypothetical protein [Flavobacterium plurextorum]OXB00783.1 hypothetical protein B0A81_20290 [Flavobacterium plurextorum]
MKLLKITFLILTLSLFSCDKKSISKPEDVGKNIFELLKNIDKKTIDDYNLQVITYEELKALANDKKAKLGNFRSEIQVMTSVEFRRRTLIYLHKLQNRGKNYKIDWSKITYSDFVFEVIESNIPDFGGESKYLKGETYFKNTDGKIYLVQSVSYYDGKGYKTILVSGLAPKD